jgi:hypothetical protein
LTYGIEVQEDSDPFVDLIEDANHNFNAATVPGAFLVDFFPSLRNLPEWLPGMGFMETARVWAKATANMVEVPYAFTKKNMVPFLPLELFGLGISLYNLLGCRDSSSIFYLESPRRRSLVN